MSITHKIDRHPRQLPLEQALLKSLLVRELLSLDWCRKLLSRVWQVYTMRQPVLCYYANSLGSKHDWKVSSPAGYYSLTVVGLYTIIEKSSTCLYHEAVDLMLSCGLFGSKHEWKVSSPASYCPLSTVALYAIIEKSLIGLYHEAVDHRLSWQPYGCGTGSRCVEEIHRPDLNIEWSWWAFKHLFLKLTHDKWIDINVGSGRSKHKLRASFPADYLPLLGASSTRTQLTH